MNLKKFYKKTSDLNPFELKLFLTMVAQSGYLEGYRGWFVATAVRLSYLTDMAINTVKKNLDRLAEKGLILRKKDRVKLWIYKINL